MKIKPFLVIASLILLVIAAIIYRMEHVGSGSDEDIFNPPKLNETERQYLISRGLKEPEVEIIEDLMSHPELIPCKGILGGTQEFFRNEISILDRRQVNAYFEDGHNGGHMSLTYKVEHGKITWKVRKWSCD